MKHTIKLPERFTAQLLQLPEDGMGYQFVDVELKDGRILSHVVVLNAGLLQVSEDIEPTLIVSVRKSKRSNAA
jgi:hypothetical protein